MKVSIITYHRVYNYGAALQAYATEKIFEKLGYEAEIVDYIPPKVKRYGSYRQISYESKMFYSNPLKKFIVSIVKMPSYRKQRKVFDKFLDVQFKMSRPYYSIQELRDNPPEADLYCTGSDQVWNSSWNQGFLPAMFLAFAPDNAMKFAFCSSFGKTKLSEEEKKQASPLLDRLEYISVRESTALPVLESMGIKNGIHLLDPTLLLPSAFWDRIAAKRLVDHDYILVYQLNDGEKFDNYAKEFAGRKGLPLVHIGMRMKYKKKEGKVFIMPEVEEFLSLIKYASYVITDSFHGTAFSINYNREIIDIYPEEFSTRLHSILDWAGLLSRHLTDYSNFQIADEPVDYKPINDKLEIERNKAREYLKVVAEQTAANKRR